MCYDMYDPTVNRTSETTFRSTKSVRPMLIDSPFVG